MMQVPTHLKECLIPNDNIIDEENFEGTLQCTCGSTEFKLKHMVGANNHSGTLTTVENDNFFFFAIKAQCAVCEKEYLLFDKDYHGWDGYVCHDVKQASLPRPDFGVYKCDRCSGENHKMYIWIETQGKADFIEETCGEFPIDRWPDAFSWFSMKTECTNCKKTNDELVSYETM